MHWTARAGQKGVGQILPALWVRYIIYFVTYFWVSEKDKRPVHRLLSWMVYLARNIHDAPPVTPRCIHDTRLRSYLFK